MLLHRRPSPRKRLKSWTCPSAIVLAVFVTVGWANAANEGAGQISSVTSSGAANPVFEEWVVVTLAGKTCGYGSTITTRSDTPTGPEFTTLHEEQFVVKRLGTELKIIEKSKIKEDAQGGVLSFDETENSGSVVETTGFRDGDEIVFSSRGQTQRVKLPRLAALGPEAVRQLSLAVPLKEGQAYSFNTFSSDYPQAVVVETGKVAAHEMHDVRGLKRKLWRLTSEESFMPGLLSTEWVDDQGNDVESLSVLPGLGDLHEYVATREECLKRPEGAEIFSTSLIHPDRAIPSPHSLGQAVYRLVPVDLTRQLTLWNGGEQRVLTSEPGLCEIEVTAPRYTAEDATWRLPHADTPALHRYLQPSAYLEVNAPDIQRLGRQAVGTETNPVLAADRIEKFVRAYITKKDLNIGFASAEETAKAREGDCTEHSVLCAALGRVVGLPTRCVVGFGYIPPGHAEPTISKAVDADTGIFGFHMWAEAWIGPDMWVPMDAALDGFDVGHIAITKSALEEVNPIVDLNAPVLQLMDNLKIEVVKTVLKIEMPPVVHALPPATAKTATSSPPTVLMRPPSSVARHGVTQPATEPVLPGVD